MSALRQGLAVSALTLFSRILGFVRESVAAQLFGANAATDAFYAVFRLPNMMRQLLAEGGFTLALLPLLHAAQRSGGQQARAQLATRALLLLMAVLMPLTLLGLLLGPWLVDWLLPPTVAGVDADSRQLALHTLWWTLPYVLMAGLLGWSAALLHAQERFVTAAITPLLLSAAMIAVPLLHASSLQQPVLALAIGVLAGGLLQLLWQSSALRQLPRPWLQRPKRDRTASWQLLRALLPALLAAATLQLIVLLDTVFASRLDDGSVTWLYLAERIVQVPQGVIGTALSVVLVQQLASVSASSGSTAHTLDRALRLVWLLGMLTAAGAWTLAQPITHALYGYGQFDLRDVQQTASALAVMGCAAPAALLVRALSAACVAQHRLRMLCLASAIALLADLLGNLLLSREPPAADAHVRIAMVGAGAVWIYALALLLGLWRSGGLRLHAGTLGFMVRVSLATALTCWLMSHAPQWSGWTLSDTAAWQRLLQLAMLLGATVLLYTGGLWLSGLRPRDLR